MNDEELTLNQVDCAVCTPAVSQNCQTTTIDLQVGANETEGGQALGRFQGGRERKDDGRDLYTGYLLYQFADLFIGLRVICAARISAIG